MDPRIKKIFRKLFNTIQLAKTGHSKIIATYYFNLDQWLIIEFHYLISHALFQLHQNSISTISLFSFITLKCHTNY